MKKLSIVFTILLLLCSLPMTGAAAAKQQFKDVPPSKHFAKAVNELAARDIIGGYPDGTFKPGNSITRGQAAAIIAKMIGLDTSFVQGKKFKDVPESYGFYKAVAKMAEEGIIGGYPDGSFRPDEPIKRKNMASILVKAFGLPHDANVKNPFKGEVGITEDVLIIYKLGITSGTSPTTFSPNMPITRGQAASMLTAAENVMANNSVIVKANDLKWALIDAAFTEDEKPHVFNIIQVKDKDRKKDHVKVVPVKEGKGKMVVWGRDSADAAAYQKYYVEVKKVNGKLQLALEKTNDTLPTELALNTKYKKTEKISLISEEGELMADNVPAARTEYNFTYIIVEEPGNYFAEVRFANGERARYKVTMFTMDDSFYYGAMAWEVPIDDGE